MAKNLVIVESPAKVKTIKKFLGSSYDVMASNGHIRDLPKSTLGIDVENDFEPKYITIRGKGDLLSELKKAASKANKVYLATDPDREGEAISWHLLEAMKLDEKKAKRISFNEITGTAVKAAIKSPRSIDMDLVDEQQARRCLDRLVGYKISPVLWKKVKRGLSAGRVQSVALRLVADRDNEINAFIPEEYWSLDVLFEYKGLKKPFVIHYYGKDGKKVTLGSEAEVNKVKSDIGNSTFTITDVKKGERVRKAPLPFTTSTLQQDAAHLLGFTTSKTMRIAQQLYEGVSVAGRGTSGLITYLRTDSTRISDEADAAVKKYINNRFGGEYVSKYVTKANTNKKAQDAHEAIRPTDVFLEPDSVKDSLSRDQLRLYRLVWQRFVASRMDAARYETLAITLEAGAHVFNASSSKLVFEGFRGVYSGSEEKSIEDAIPQALSKGDRLTPSDWQEEQHFTQPPAHYTEATLVKTLEDLGIGRPSTYAPTITLIQQRNYVAKEKRSIFITELGEVVNNMMSEAFSDIVDVAFTANMESELDKVGEGEASWKEVLRDFWPDFNAAVLKAEKELEHVKVADEVTDVICEECGRNMVVKYGRHGKFLACPGFPECKNTKPFLEKTGIKCPKCGGEVIVKRTKKGRKYYGCENNPTCDFMSWKKPEKT